MTPTFVILGAGHAGGEAAAALRARGFEGRVVIVGDEAHPPHERPPLSKQLLAGEYGPEQTYLKPLAFYHDRAIELRLGVRVAAIERETRTVLMEDGEPLPYDKLLIATGARPRRLAVPGAELAGVHYLRTIDDSLAIREGLREGARVVIVGGGYIGLEVAAVARGLGADVTVLEMMDRVMARVVGHEISDFFQGLHRANGVRLCLGAAVAAIEGAGRAERVLCTDGTACDADLVIVGVGVVPNVELAGAAGLEVDDGIVVDKFAATSDADIFAAGDVTNHPNAILGGRLRLESVHNAAAQAQAAARAMLGKPQAYSEVPWFWSDQYGLKLQMAGISREGDETVVRGAPESHRFSVLYLRSGRVVAVNAINNMRDFMPAKRMIAGAMEIDPGRLADVEISLKELL